MDDRIARSLGEQRFRAVLMATLGALALVLALIGIHGVVANAVVRRTREIGVRIALGQATFDVATRVVLDALRVAAAGVAIGLVLALLTGHWLAAFLVGVSVHDPVTLAAATAGMLLVVAAAAAAPARRAARVDPIVALKAE
jgi:ABC-type antimicrobial peptide transport system permease subunit